MEDGHERRSAIGKMRLQLSRRNLRRGGLICIHAKGYRRRFPTVSCDLHHRQPPIINFRSRPNTGERVDIVLNVVVWTPNLINVRLPEDIWLAATWVWLKRSISHPKYPSNKDIAKAFLEHKPE